MGSVLNRHHKEDGVVEAMEDLKAAKTNYTQRSLDQMLTWLILAIHDLIAHPPSEELRRELNAVVHDFYRWAMTGATGSPN
ncbi:MAG: hypothetical protein HY820_22785 [Acidobacteria bacterium]|nr:hypothetical protein [Acidobacteriota bacterium]